MKCRVERCRTDNGYGPGWVVLDWTGDVVWHSETWEFAMFGAFVVVSQRAGIS